MAGTIWDAISRTEDRLKENGISGARREALLMLSQILGTKPSQIIQIRAMPFGESNRKTLEGWVERRLKREPLQYIIGETEFRGVGFMVGPAVLIPRPETEHLVEESVNALKPGPEKPMVLDLCTGSGCVSVCIAMEVPRALVLATDNSPDAIETTVKNALVNDVIERVECLEGDLFDAVKDLPLEGKFDLIVANPPYIKSADIGELEPEVSDYEPRAALDGGEDGLEFIKRIIEGAPRYMKPGGTLIFEVGYDQAEEVEGLLEESEEFESVDIIKDYSGIERVVKARKIGEEETAP
ncbi:MAG: peptide chain release factor N(5)-glutamine methyltransferase [Thermodesulfobacteriota bacterium]